MASGNRVAPPDRCNSSENPRRLDASPLSQSGHATPRTQVAEARYYPMTESEILREQARTLRDLAIRPQATPIKELLLHMAEQCERLAQRFEREHC
ncbi:MAG TPA: hypothetical protein VNW24_13995 [Stellaceae bacterium]|nr:hypothetical protein [Stellaceae bacterium]